MEKDPGNVGHFPDPPVGVQGSHHVAPSPPELSPAPVGHSTRKLAGCRARRPGSKSPEQGGRGQKGARLLGAVPASPAAPTPAPPADNELIIFTSPWLHAAQAQSQGGSGKECSGLVNSTGHGAQGTGPVSQDGVTARSPLASLMAANLP